ncbi:GIY-YIG nuclease family protein [bacterium]|nr:MAG: GIY-YIG nuclease family protein [bacterium]
MKSWFVYIVECKDGTLYTGITDNVERRVAVHNAGNGAKYTKGRTPAILRFVEEVVGRSEAQKREAEIKRMTRERKINLW